jgi:DNA-binding response OmpR family regulator
MTNGRQAEVAMVLVVEDNADMRSFIKAQLKEDYKILEAGQGKAGLEIAQQAIPDLIITDLMMPQMDGMELCHQLKTDERTSHIPVIMLTAKAGQEHKIEGLETGADDYLTKPFDRQELQVRVKNLIVQRQRLRERFSREITLEPRQIAITSLDEQFLQKVMELLENNLADTSFGMAEMQDALAMSKTQLYRKIKALTDQSPGEFIRNYRLKRAAQILSQQGENVTQVAYSVGFNNLSYFAKCFKEMYNVAPSEYKSAAHS